MSTLYLTSWNHLCPGTAGSGFADAVTAAGLTTDAGRGGRGGFRANPAGGAYFWRKTFTAKNLYVVRVMVRRQTLPSSGTRGQVVSGIMGANHWNIQIDSNGVLYGSFRDGSEGLLGSESTGPTLPNDGVHHCLDVVVDLRANPNTIAFKLDSGTEVTGASFAQAATTSTTVQIGQVNTTATYQLDFCDLKIMDAIGDYPIGPGHVIGIGLGSDGTHSFQNGDFRRGETGTTLTGTVTDAYTFLDDAAPLPTAPSTTDFIGQILARSTSYLEVKPATGVAEAGTASDVQAYLGYCASGTQANSGGCIVRNSAGFAGILWGDLPSAQGGNGGALADYSDSSSTIQNKFVIVSKPGAGWTATEIEAIRFRFGGAGDASPVPEWHFLLLEVDYPDVSGNVYQKTGAVIGAGALSGGRVREFPAKPGAAVSALVASAAKNINLGKKSIAVSPAVLAGTDVSTYAETGTPASEGKASGLGDLVAAKSGIGISPAVITGAGSKARERLGTALAPAIASGVDASLHSETGLALSVAVAAGTDVSAFAESASLVSEAKASGVDVAEHVETGTGIMDAVASGTRPGTEQQKLGRAIIGEDTSVLGSGAVDTVTKNGVLKDFDPPSGIDNVKEIRFDPTAQTYQAGMVVACPQGDSGAVLTTPNGDMTDTVWDQNRVNDDGFFTAVKNAAGTKYFSSNMRIGGTTGSDEPIAVLPRDAAKHGYEDGDILWDEETRPYRGPWAPNTVYANNDVVVGGMWVWRSLGGGTSGSSPPTWPSSSQAGNTSVDESSAGFGGDAFWSMLGEYHGDWVASTDFFPNIWNDGSGNPVYCRRPYVTLPGTPTKIITMRASTLGMFATATSEPSWNGANNNRSMYRDGDIYWISGGSSLFGGPSGSHGAEQLVVTGLEAPATDGKIIKITNLGTSGMQVVLSDHRTHRDFWGITPTDADSAVGNRFLFQGNTGFRNDRYIRAGESRFIIYSAADQSWREYVPSGASLAGATEKSLGKKNSIISPAVLTGHHIPENAETGSQTSALTLAGSISKVINRQNTVASALIALGADASTINKAGSFFSEGKLSGVRISERNRAGMAVATLVATGGDASEHQETGIAISSGAPSGVDIHEAVESGSIVSSGVVSGQDTHEATEQGSAISSAIASGAKASDHLRTGSSISESKLSGPDVSEHSETGAVISPRILLGTDIHEAVETGAVISAGVPSGQDVHEAIDQGSAISSAAASGSRTTDHLRAGSAISERKISGTDISEHSETGLGIVGSTLSGQGTKDQSAKFGLMASEAGLSGQDASEHSRTGQSSSEIKMSGIDSHEAVETGVAISAASVSGFDSAERPKTGSSISDASLRGQDVTEHVETGAASSAAAASGTGRTDEAKGGLLSSDANIRGADASEHARAGAATSEVRMTGIDAEERVRSGSVLSTLSFSAARSRDAARMGLVTANSALSGSKNALLNKVGSFVSELVLLGEKVYELFRRHGRSEANDFLRAVGESEFLIGHCEADDWLRAEGESEVYTP